MTAKQKLELTWIGKEHRPKLEPRILLESPAKSYHAAHRVSDNDCFDNRLIFGDNLIVLKALEAEFSGKIKCVFIDPPNNTACEAKGHVSRNPSTGGFEQTRHFCSIFSSAADCQQLHDAVGRVSIDFSEHFRF